MRISTLTMFERNTSSMNRQQSEFLKVGQQFASGKRVLNPSDDPMAASRAVGLNQAKAVTQQYMDARITARNALSQEEGVLNSLSDAITSAKTLMVQAANGTLNDADRGSVASELRGIYETVFAQANATDGNGRYLFGGYQDSKPPFVKGTDGTVSYEGDTNTRELRVDASRLMPVGDNGKTIFQSDGAEEMLFATFEKAIAALETPTGGDADKQAALHNTVNTAMRELDNSLDKVLSVRASVGARLNELDVVDTIAGNRMLNYEQTLSDLVDLDYVQAASDYSLRMVGLQAAQKSFVDIQGMSLFNFLK